LPFELNYGSKIDFFLFFSKCHFFFKGNVNPYVLDMNERGQLEKLEIDIFYTAEMDEFWSFVENKSNQSRTWYVIDKASCIILAWHIYWKENRR